MKTKRKTNTRRGGSATRVKQVAIDTRGPVPRILGTSEAEYKDRALKKRRARTDRFEKARNRIQTERVRGKAVNPTPDRKPGFLGRVLGRLKGGQK